MMAQRFGGKYSPNAQGTPGSTDPAAQAVVTADNGSGVGLQANLLFALPLPFLLKAFSGAPSHLFVGLGAAGLLLLAAWLTREGIKAQISFDARRVARRPAFPRKLAAAALTGAALLLGTIAGDLNPLFPVLFGIVGAFLHIGAFGPDPMRAKGLEGVDSFQTDRVAKAVDEGEGYLAAMKDAILRADDAALEARVERFAGIARGLFRSIEGDPGDLSAARRYFSVYLAGARDATVKFADVYARGRSATARADYESLLTDLETNFAARTKALTSDNHGDLDIEIQVLRDRLKLEG